jgi:hypothetical protein
MTLRRRAAAAGIIIAAVVLAVFAFQFWSVHLRDESRPHGGLTRSDAVKVAQAHVDQGSTGIRSAELQQGFHTGFDIPVHPWTWVVTFNGQWHLLCQGPSPACDSTTEWVAVDYYTGEWIASQFSYPAP